MRWSNINSHGSPSTSKTKTVAAFTADLKVRTTIGHVMRACIIAVGSEMLTPFRVDTNSLFVTELLNTIGYDVRMKSVVGDDVAELTSMLRGALEWADVIVLTGGLGPTE